MESLLIPALNSPYLTVACRLGIFSAKRTIGAQIRHCQEIGLLNLYPLYAGPQKQPLLLLYFSLTSDFQISTKCSLRSTEGLISGVPGAA